MYLSVEMSNYILVTLWLMAKNIPTPAFESTDILILDSKKSILKEPY